MELKDVLKAYRAENGLSQREFAKRCGLSNTHISNLEAGVNPQTGKKTVSDIGTYQKIAAAMGMSLRELFDKIGDQEYIDTTLPDPINPNVPKTSEARLLARGVDSLPKAQRERVLQMFQLMFDKNTEFFEKGETDDDA